MDARVEAKQSAESKTVAAAVVEALQAIGVRYVFGVPSGGWVDYMEALRQADGIDFVLTTHEGPAAMMADVCGRLTGVPGACFGTFGPGATNLATGVGGALLDRSPLIAFTDEMPEGMRGRTTQMGIDHQALFRPLTKLTTRLDADHVKRVIFDSARVAMSERPGSVHIGLPTGLSAKAAGEEPGARPQQPDPIAAPAPDLFAKMRALLGSARKPLLALGLSAARANSRRDFAEKLLQFAENHRLPVVLSPMAKGLVPEDHPCYAGVVFHALSDMVGETHQQADLVIAIGYDPVEFNFESWLPKTAVVTIDTLPADLDPSAAAPWVDIVGDIGAAVDHLVASNIDAKDWDMEAMAARRRRMFSRMAAKSANFVPTAALDILRRLLPADGIMTCDVGAHTHLIGQKWLTPRPGLQIMTNGWSTMGFGIPSAIAAKLCRPETEVCTVVGDGGFLMTAGELAVAVRLNLKIVIVLLTDNDLALIRIKQEKKGKPIYGTPIRERGTIGGDVIFGVPVLRATDERQFESALAEAFRSNGPTVVEAVVDSREYDGLVLKKDKH